MSQNKMPPDRYSQMIKHLTRKKIKNPFIPASAIQRPKKVLEIEAFQDFNVRNPKAGGGMLVQPSADGSRPGYADELTTKGTKRVRRILGDPITIDGKKYKKVIAGPDKGKYMIKGDKFDLAAGERAYREFVEKSKIRSTVKKRKEAGKKSKEQLYVKRQAMAKNAISNRNKWIKNWINNNIDNYEVRDFDKFTKNLSDEFNKELLNNPDSYKYYMKTAQNIDPKTNLPILGTSTQRVTIDGITFPRIDEPNRNQVNAYKKWFYNKKLKDKDFKTKLNFYLDWNLTKKVKGGAGSMTKTAALDYGKFTKGFDDDVIFFMGEVLNDKALNPGGGQVGIHDIFKKNIGKKGKAYLTKYQGTWGRWRDNFDAVAKLAGLNQSQAKALLQKQINDSQNIMKLFNVKNLPPEFVVAQDHLFGLAEAKALGDPKIARQTLQALVATTKEQNRILGQGGFSQKRVALIKKFKNALPEEKINIVNKLNTLSQEYVPDRIQYSLTKDDALRITNLQPEKTFKSKAEAYEKLTKTFPKNIQNKLLKNTISYSKKAECKVNLKADGGRIGFANSIECIQDGLKEQKLEAQKGNKKAAQELIEISKVATRAGLLKNVLGPGAILGEAVYEGAVIGNKVLGGTPADIAYAESYLSYLDPRKYRGELDPETMRREDMLESTADKNILRSGFAAQDQLSAFNKAIEDRDLAKARGRIDQYVPAAADVREQAKFADQSADIISSEAFKDATNVAQEYLQGQAGKQMADFGVFSVPQSTIADEGRRVRAMSEMRELNPLMSDQQILELLKEYNIDPKDYDYTYTPRNFPADTSSKPLTGFDDIRDFYQQQAAMQNIADAGGIANLAGGGIAKLAGVDSGPPPERGPNSQGLQGLMKRVRNF